MLYASNFRIYLCSPPTGGISPFASDGAVRRCDASMRVKTTAMPQTGPLGLQCVPREATAAEPVQTPYCAYEGYEVSILTIFYDLIFILNNRNNKLTFRGLPVFDDI